MTNSDFSRFYAGKTVLVTGHTGFKGSWLSLWLCELGAKVVGYALDPVTDRDNFVLAGLSAKMTDIRGDIRDRGALRRVFDKYQPEIVFHLAAQPLVRLSYEIPVETYETNVMGTIHVLEEIRRCPATRSAVLITTDKCYENREQIWGYRECDPLGGHDPYSSSKAAGEIAIQSWQRSFMNPLDHARHGKAIASARAGNVIGGGDWAKDRIVPDCIRALEKNQPIEIRNPGAVRPWEHVLEPLGGYLRLGKKLYEDPVAFSGAWNFGPEASAILSVREIAELIVKYYGKGELQFASQANAPHEATLLTLDITKARVRLGWSPRLSPDETVAMTVDWYVRQGHEDVYRICQEQIRHFQALPRK